jgi:hypothetical protein
MKFPEKEQEQENTSCIPPFPCGELNRLDDFRVGPAAAQVSGQVMLDRVLVRVGMLVEKLARHQHESRRAEAALERARFDERLLDGIRVLSFSTATTPF